MRGKREGEDLSRCEEVSVVLAGSNEHEQGGSHDRGRPGHRANHPLGNAWRINGIHHSVAGSVPGALQVADVGTKPFTAPRLSELKRMMGIGVKEAPKDEVEGGREKEEEERKKDEVKKEDGRRRQADLETVEKIVKLIALMGSIQGSYAQEDGEEGEGTAYYVTLILAALGGTSLVVMTWWLVACGIKQASGRKMKDDENESEEEEEDVEESEAEEEGQVEAEVTEEDRGHQNDEARERGADTEKKTVEEAARSSTEEVKVKPVMTPWGNRWHSAHNCPTLHRTRRIERSEWCALCAPQRIPEDVPIFAKGPGETAHYDQKCRRRGRETKKYEKCQICVEKEEKKK